MPTQQFLVLDWHYPDNRGVGTGVNNEANMRPSYSVSIGSPVAPFALFEILVRENADSLTAFLRASVEDLAAADDLFQETMLVACRRIGDYDATRPFGAWLRGIARRQIMAYFRRIGRDVVLSDERILDYLDRRMFQVDAQPGDTLDERIAALRLCIEQLTTAYREPIDMHYRQKQTTHWIAERLATSKDAVQKRLQRAREQLAECLARKGVLTTAE